MCKGFANLPILSKIERLEQFSVLKSPWLISNVSLRLHGSVVYFLFITIEEALFLNILVLHYFSLSKPCCFFLSKISRLSDKKKYFDYCYKDGGKGPILLSLKCFCHCSNVFSITETYLKCFSFPLINCNSWNTAAFKSLTVRL